MDANVLQRWRLRHAAGKWAELRHRAHVGSLRRRRRIVMSSTIRRRGGIVSLIGSSCSERGLSDTILPVGNTDRELAPCRAAASTRRFYELAGCPYGQTEQRTRISLPKMSVRGLSRHPP